MAFTYAPSLARTSGVQETLRLVVAGLREAPGSSYMVAREAYEAATANPVNDYFDLLYPVADADMLEIVERFVSRIEDMLEAAAVDKKIYQRFHEILDRLKKESEEVSLGLDKQGLHRIAADDQIFATSCARLQVAVETFGKPFVSVKLVGMLKLPLELLLSFAPSWVVDHSSPQWRAERLQVAFHLDHFSRAVYEILVFEPDATQTPRLPWQREAVVSDAIPSWVEVMARR